MAALECSSRDASSFSSFAATIAVRLSAWSRAGLYSTTSAASAYLG